MIDLQPLIRLSATVASEPTEEHLEAFLQAYNATQPPTGRVEFVLFEVLGDMTITEYMDPSCTCDHEHEGSTNV